VIALTSEPFDSWIFRNCPGALLVVKSVTCPEAEVICCDYSDSSEDCVFGFIQHSPILGPACPPKSTEGAPRHSRVPTLRILGKRPLSDWVGAVGFPDRPLVIQTSSDSFSGEIRHNLMMTTPRLLVALKPTEERLRQARKPGLQTNEKGS